MSRSSCAGTDERKSLNVLNMAKCLGISYIISVVLLFLLSVLAAVTDMEKFVINGCVTGITMISVALCGFMAAKKTGKGGLLNGVVAGLLYTVLLYAMGSLAVGSFNFNWVTAAAAAEGIICGGAGGVLGVNMGKRRR